ncbi:tetratricopeptide repeat protein [Nitrospirillum iridis]|uniref:Sulfotransferase domain-containing protein n=1 Tax=Nitrospirillum iridis TaxID=765888 RepID=A0A7X0AY58_9PROT|nr:sulfotransferase domain-containing protein [Nitrospirillum iridis]MBB6252274.1 hypothetical protein [Nitrospirillum iridis]
MDTISTPSFVQVAENAASKSDAALARRLAAIEAGTANESTVFAHDPLPSIAAAADHLAALASWWPGASRQIIHLARAQSQTDTVLQILEAALSLNPLWANDLVVLQNCLAASGRLNDLIALCDRVQRRHPSIPIHLLPHARPSGLEAAHQRQQERKRAGMPAVLLNTLPKSGSMFLQEVLARSFDLPTSTIAISDHALTDQVVHGWATQLAQGGALSQEHLPGTPAVEQALLAAGLDKIIVHVRDPRQTMLSTLHHFSREYRLCLEIHKPFLPANYPGLPFEEQAEFMLEHYFAKEVEWIVGWTRIVDSGSPLKVLFSTYEESVSNVPAFFARACKFYDLEGASTVALAEVAPSAALHFREGRKDEWRTAFRQEQQDRMRALMPDALMDRFGWYD